MSMNTETNYINERSSNSPKPRRPINWPLLLLSCCFMVLGIVGGPLLLRLYYLHGGQRRWLATAAQSAGFPIILIPLSLLFITSRLNTSLEPPSRFFIEPKLLLYSALIGLLVGFSNFLYSVGLSYLPLSTSTILQATQIVFVSLFSRLIVKQRFTAFSVNSVVLMILGCVVLGVRANGDRPAGVSSGQYLLGFFLSLLSAAMVGAAWPCVELSYSKATRPVDYRVVLQFQFNLSLFSTVVSVVGMLVNKDFQAMHREAEEYGLGRSKYFATIVGATILFQIALLGSVGLIFSSSSLFCGIFNSVLVPIIDIAALIAYHEAFTAEKGMALALCLWGFVSYFYGEYRMINKEVSEVPSKQEVDP